MIGFERLARLRACLLDELPCNEEQPDNNSGTNDSESRLHHVARKEFRNLILESADVSSCGRGIDSGSCISLNGKGGCEESREKPTGLFGEFMHGGMGWLDVAALRKIVERCGGQPTNAADCGDDKTKARTDSKVKQKTLHAKPYLIGFAERTFSIRIVL